MEKLNQCEENLLKIMENINALNENRLAKLVSTDAENNMGFNNSGPNDTQM